MMATVPFFPVIQTTSDNILPNFGGEQADSVPASVEQWGTALKNQHHHA